MAAQTILTPQEEFVRAAYFGEKDKVNALLARSDVKVNEKAAINEKGSPLSEQWTAVDAAAFNKHVDIVDKLVTAGALLSETPSRTTYDLATVGAAQYNSTTQTYMLPSEMKTALDKARNAKQALLASNKGAGRPQQAAR